MWKETDPYGAVKISIALGEGTRLSFHCRCKNRSGCSTYSLWRCKVKLLETSCMYPAQGQWPGIFSWSNWIQGSMHSQTWRKPQSKGHWCIVRLHKWKITQDSTDLPLALSWKWWLYAGAYIYYMMVFLRFSILVLFFPLLIAYSFFSPWRVLSQFYPLHLFLPFFFIAVLRLRSWNISIFKLNCS